MTIGSASLFHLALVISCIKHFILLPLPNDLHPSYSLSPPHVHAGDLLVLVITKLKMLQALQLSHDSSNDPIQFLLIALTPITRRIISYR
jgi:hypothetical protein